MIGAVVGAARVARYYPCNPFKLFRVEIVRRAMRYRCEYLHVPTSSRILFTVPVGGYEGEYLGTAGEAMAKRAATKWIETTGIGSECVMLGVVEVTDKMSVRLP
jgi:hypothetical protein